LRLNEHEDDCVPKGRHCALRSKGVDAGRVTCEHVRVTHVEVRHARQSDASAVSALNNYVHDLHVEAEPYDFRATDPSEVRTFFEFIINAPNHVVLLATADDAPAGYLWVEDKARPATPFKNPTRVLSLNHISVEPQFRRLGVGRALYQAAERKAHELGVTRLVMDHWAFNEDAAAFFGSLGFQSFNIRMRKDLPAGS
jgi:ribosomal protein S18 acetylase RimI-like enzyme